MNSPLLALFIRSVREEVRSRATYWARAGLGGFLLLVVALFALSNRWTGAPGKVFFTTVISFQAVAVALVGLSYFGSAITEEKEEQTLGLLRMTSLNPLSILLGKSTSRLCGALLLLVGQVPFTIFAVTLGGVSLGQIAAVYCALGAFMFLLCNLALLGSVLARRTSEAAAFCVLVLVILLGSVWLFGFLHDQLTGFPRLQTAFGDAADALWNSTPIARLQEVLSTGFSGPPVGWQVLSNLTAGIGCFFLAWALFGRFCDRAPGGASAESGPGGGRFGRRWLRPPRAWKNALVWKDFYFVCGGSLGFTIRMVCYGGAFLPFICRATGVWGVIADMARAMSEVTAFVFSIDAALLASRIFGLELREQTLTALAALPCTMRKIVYRKAFGCLLAAAPGIAAVIAIQMLSLHSFAVIPAGTSLPFSMRQFMILQTLSGWATTVLMVQVAAWLSLYLKRGAAPIAFVGTHAAMMVVAMLCSVVVAMNAFRAFNSASALTPNFSFIVLGPIISVVVGIVAALVFHFLGLRRLEVLAGES